MRDLLLLTSINRIQLTDEEVKAIPFKLVKTNEEVEEFRSSTQPYKKYEAESETSSTTSSIEEYDGYASA
jgi:hypothetical protein